jgi:Luciferase-like monooxygenase
MQLGASLPIADIGTGSVVLRDYAQAAEGLGFDFLLAADHVLGNNPAATVAHGASTGVSCDHARRIGTTALAFHDPLVLFGFLSGCTTKIGFATGVLILAQRQAALVAKQAASLDELCGGRFASALALAGMKSNSRASAWTFTPAAVGLTSRCGSCRRSGRNHTQHSMATSSIWMMAASPCVRNLAVFRSGSAVTPRQPSDGPRNTATATCRLPTRPGTRRWRRLANCVH